MFKIINHQRNATLSTAEKSYPRSEVRGSGLECQAATAQERPRGATLRPRPGVMAERRYPASEARGGSREKPPWSEARDGGREEKPHA